MIKISIKYQKQTVLDHLDLDIKGRLGWFFRSWKINLPSQSPC